MIPQRPNDQLLSLVHRERQRLEDKLIAVTIDNYSRESVTLAPDDPAEPRIDPTPRPIFDRLCDPPLEKIEIQILAPPRESPGDDLRFAVVNRAADQAVSSVLQRNNVAICRTSERLQHFTAENPVVPMENPRAGFDDDSCHEERVNGDR
jgi:hypothetical protein